MSALRVAVAMSGGVDSSVTAQLLRRQGHQVVGVTLRLQPDASAAAAEDARRVAEVLGVEFHLFDARQIFEQRVLAPFAQAYRDGLTPNPCILCNRGVKFGWLREQLAELGCDALATGHYARLAGDPGRRRLLRGLDPGKDQSYFLVPKARDVLDRVLFPLGELRKEQVRDIARDAGLPVAAKPESQDACFMPRGGLQSFLAGRGDAATAGDATGGDIVDRDGRVLGRHRGVHAYTVGQRKGLGVAAPQPLYVLRKDARHNRLVVGPRDALACSGLCARDPVWLSTSLPLHEAFACTVKLRSTARDVACEVRCDGEHVQVHFAAPQYGVAPGQMAVFYRDQRVLGGAWIDQALPAAGEASGCG